MVIEDESSTICKWKYLVAVETAKIDFCTYILFITDHNLHIRSLGGQGSSVFQSSSLLYSRSTSHHTLVIL
jgi:hypothetical protein